MIKETFKLESDYGHIDGQWKIDSGWASLWVNGKQLIQGQLTKINNRGWEITLFTVYTGKAEKWFLSRGIWHQ